MLLILFVVVCALTLPPLVLAILLGRWRPQWSYMTTALVAATAIPLLLGTGMLLLAASEALDFRASFYAATTLIITYVFEVLAASVGAWMAPRPPQSRVDASVEDVFR